MTRWFSLLPYVLGFTIVLFVPGVLFLSALRLPRWLTLSAAPAISAFFVALAMYLGPVMGYQWGWLPLACVTLVASGVAAVVSLLVRRRISRAEVSTERSGKFSIRHWDWWLIGAICIGTLTALIPILHGMTSPKLPLQQWDAVFHMNAVTEILDTGNAATLPGMYGGANPTPYYPTVWHAMVALAHQFAGARTAFSVVMASNASTLVMASIGWLIPVAGLARAVFPGKRLIPVLAVLVAGAFSMFPAFQLSLIAQWPNGLSTMMLPGVAALVIVAVRGTVLRARGLAGREAVVWWGLWVTSAAAVIGLGLTHGSAVFALLVIVGPCVAIGVWQITVLGWRAGKRFWVAASWILGGVAFVSAAKFIADSPIFATLTNYNRPNDEPIGESILRTVFDARWGVGTWNLLLGLMMITGCVWAFRVKEGRHLAVGTAGIVFLTACALSSSEKLQSLTGIWYSQAARIEAVFPALAAVLAAGGLFWLAGLLAGFLFSEPRTLIKQAAVSMALVLVIAVATHGFNAAQREQLFTQAYVPKKIHFGTMLTRGEIGLLERLPEVLPPDAVVVGNPYYGASFTWSIGQRQALLPHLGVTSLPQREQFIAQNFNKIHTDPRVCEYLGDFGVKYYYHEGNTGKKWNKLSHSILGFKNVDVSTGFAKVASGGGATIYRITACG